MEKIQPTDKVMNLMDLNYSAVYSVIKYLYIGKFTRENISNDLYKPAIMKLEVYNLLPILKQDNCVIEGFSPKFERLLNLNFLSDLKIVVKESKKSEREIFCHKMILCARSSYFRTMYHSGFKESDAAELIVDDCSYEAMMFIIKYYYIDVTKIEDESIVCDVLRLAHMYDEKPVISMVEVFLRDHLSIENVCFVLLLRDLFSMSDELKLACEDFISYRFKKVSKTSAFKKLSSEVQSRLERQKKEGPWLLVSASDSQALLKQLKNFTL
jgi:hypothetical protein